MPIIILSDFKYSKMVNRLPSDYQYMTSLELGYVSTNCRNNHLFVKLSS